jgi:hypothetical protein
MGQTGRTGGLALALLLALTLVGCGDGTPPASSSLEPATVKGKVKQRGTPLAKLEIRFNATNINRREAPEAMAITNDDGSYEVKTVVGENTITFTGPAVSKYSKQLIYFNKSVDLQAGENSVDIEVP